MASTVETQAPARRIGGGPTRSVAAASWTALGALMLRDLVVLRKHIWEFVLRTIIQPFLLCFVFLYVFPKIGQGIGADTIVTVRATGDLDRLAELLASDVEGVTRTRVAGDRLELHMREGDRLVPRIVLAAEHGGFELVDVSIAEPSLETVFISLTGRELREE